MTTNVLLAGVVGSTAYGLNTEDSDVDMLGVFACDTRELHGLKDPVETHVGTKPDITLHEARKFCKLALRCNPTVLELLWLEGYSQKEQLGEELRGLRKHFLSQQRVREAYLGYATQQMRLLAMRVGQRGVMPARVEKNARHLRRLIYQGTRLYSEGVLEIRVRNPEAYHEFGQRVAAGGMDLVFQEMAWAEKFFDDATPGIPAEPSAPVIERWLQRVRAEYWKRM